MGELTEQAKIAYINDFYRKQNAGKSEHIETLQADNNELHKDVYSLNAEVERLCEALESVRVVLKEIPSYDLEASLKEAGEYHREVLRSVGVL